MNRDEAEEALQRLTASYGQLLGKASRDALEREAGGDDASTYGYAWEEREERLAARLRNLQVLIGSLQQALAQPVEPRIWVETLELDRAVLAKGINERLATCGEEMPINVSVVPGEAAKVTVLLTFRGPALATPPSS